MTTTTIEITWINQVLRDLGLELKSSCTLYYDDIVGLFVDARRGLVAFF